MYSNIGKHYYSSNSIFYFTFYEFWLEYVVF